MADVFCFPIRVYIEDTDAGGIVYHANHLKFCERARSEWLRANGIQHYLLQGGFAFVVHRLQAHYQQPAKMDDLLLVSVEPIACTGATFRLRQRITRAEMPIAELEVVIACVNAQGKPCRVPPAIQALIFPTP